MTPALQLRQLTKRYDDGTLALDSLDLEVPSGSFFGLLGPNGAGKTTLISAVCNLLRITEGEVLVFGEPHDSLKARAWVGLAEQDINLDRFLRVVRRFSNRSQFIIVTHQKRTMDAADALYGITMGEDGITKVVSRKLYPGYLMVQADFGETSEEPRTLEARSTLRETPGFGDFVLTTVGGGKSSRL